MMMMTMKLLWMMMHRDVVIARTCITKKKLLLLLFRQRNDYASLSQLMTAVLDLLLAARWQQLCPFANLCSLIYLFWQQWGWVWTGDVDAPCGLGAIPPYPFTSPPFTLYFSILYFSFFFFLASSIFSFSIHSQFPFYQNNPTPFPGRML